MILCGHYTHKYCFHINVYVDVVKMFHQHDQHLCWWVHCHQDTFMVIRLGRSHQVTDKWLLELVGSVRILTSQHACFHWTMLNVQHIGLKWELRRWMEMFQGHSNQLVRAFFDCTIWSDSQRYLGSVHSLGQTCCRLPGFWSWCTFNKFPLLLAADEDVWCWLTSSWSLFSELISWRCWMWIDSLNRLATSRVYGRAQCFLMVSLKEELRVLADLAQGIRSMEHLASLLTQVYWWSILETWLP